MQLHYMGQLLLTRYLLAYYDEKTHDLISRVKQTTSLTHSSHCWDRER